MKKKPKKLKKLKAKAKHNKLVKKPSKPRPKKSSASKQARAVKPKNTPITEEAILTLIERGRHRGFVTQAEIINTFPNLESDIKGLENLYNRLEATNINIIESGQVFHD